MRIFVCTLCDIMPFIVAHYLTSFFGDLQSIRSAVSLAEHPNVMGKVLVSSYLGERGAWLVIEVAQADVPTSDAMFPRSCGLGRDQRQLSCLPSADHVLNQPSLSRQTWQEVVNKMITAYKALIARRREPSTTASARLIFN